MISFILSYTNCNIDAIRNKQKTYVDSRFRTRDSSSDGDFKVDLKEPLDLPGNTVCYVDDISIPQTWRTIESHNNRFHITFKMEYLSGGGTDMTVEYNYDPCVLTLPEVNYTGANLASGIQELLHGFAVTFDFEVLYLPARGTITIEANSEGMGSHTDFYIPSDFGIMTWMSSTDSDNPWNDSQGNVTTVELNTY